MVEPVIETVRGEGYRMGAVKKMSMAIPVIGPFATGTALVGA